MGLLDFLNLVAATECFGSSALPHRRAFPCICIIARLARGEAKCRIGNDGAMGEGPFLSKIAISFNFLGADGTGGQV